MTNPHFIIAGERRSGTTTLYQLLNQHPEIDLYPVTDMDYFIKRDLFRQKEWYIDFDEEKQWQASHSKQAYAELFKDLDFNKKVGQKDADLLFWKKAHPRLADYLPKTKFIFILRNPLKRAESQYWNEMAKGREWIPFEKALELEKERSLQSDYGKLHLNYLQRGKYHESLEHFFNYIPQKQTHVVILEHLFSNTEDELKKIAQFLEISTDHVDAIKPIHSNHEEFVTIDPKLQGTLHEKVIRYYDRIVNAIIVRITHQKHRKDNLRKRLMTFGKVSIRSEYKMSKRLIAQIHEYYADSIIALEKLINTDLSFWK